MKRDIKQSLKKWKDDKRRRPLLVRGARQVGKSYTIIDFGKTYFNNLAVINFEQYPEYKKCFHNFNPNEILQNISILYKQEIIPGKTGRLKSLHLYREKYKPRCALKISQDTFHKDDVIVSLPLYAIESIKNVESFM